MSTVTALSVRAPWAFLLVNAPVAHRKPVENRDWPPEYWPRRRIESGSVRRLWIHASRATRAYYDEARAHAVEAAGFPARLFPRYESLPMGALIGTVDVVSWGDDYDGSPWWLGGWAIETGSPRPLASPVACKGALGLWTLPPELAALPAVSALTNE